MCFVKKNSSEAAEENKKQSLKSTTLRKVGVQFKILLSLCKLYSNLVLFYVNIAMHSDVPNLGMFYVLDPVERRVTDQNKM